MFTAVGVAHRSSPHHLYEDRYRVLRQGHPHVDAAGSGHIFAVMDGVGSASRGMQAAQHIADRLGDYFTLPSPSPSALGELLVAVNDEVCGWGYGADRLPLAGSTATVALLEPSDETLRLFHVGDSAAYILEGETLRALTRPHLSRGRLQRYVGLGRGLDFDAITHPFDEGDVVCLVTDGVASVMTEAEIASVLRGTRDVQEAAQRLVNKAYHNKGSRDDITAVVASLESWDEDDDAWGEL